MPPATKRPPIKALAFDAYATLFDVFSMDEQAETYFPGQGNALTRLWRQKQVDYTRIRTLCGHYKNFWEITRDALNQAAQQLRLPISEQQTQHLLNQYACLHPFPENRSTLEALSQQGLPLCILSNGTHAMLDIAVKYNEMQHLFTHILSADSVKKYKTAPEVYQLAVDALQLPPANILFVSANAWDACAASWFGFQTFWINRHDDAGEILDAQPDYQGGLLSDLLPLFQP